MDVVYDEFACRNESQDDAWAKRIDIKGRISAQVKLSSGLSVSPDILEPIYANSRLFADIYIDARSSSSAIVAIVTPAASLNDLTLPDGTPLFDFDAICPKDFFSSVEGFRNEIGTKFYTRRRKVQVYLAAAPVAGTVLCRRIAKFLLPNLNFYTIHPRFNRQHHSYLFLTNCFSVSDSSSTLPSWSAARSQRGPALLLTRYQWHFTLILSPGL